MLSLLLKCVACHEPASNLRSFPLCDPCAESLVTAPSLCPRCAGLECGQGQCLRPWVSHEGIDSLSACYLCIEPGYRVLKRWKISQGSALDRKILSFSPVITQRLQSLHPDLVVWIPQSKARSWSLGACPAEKIAHWVAGFTGAAARPALLPGSGRASSLRQAELRMHERMANRLRFKWNEECPTISGRRVLLVDDFMTTGRTLSVAARVLKSRGAVAVHGFCLGIRPMLHWEQVRSNLTRRQA